MIDCLIQIKTKNIVLKSLLLGNPLSRFMTPPTYIRKSIEWKSIVETLESVDIRALDVYVMM